MRSAARSHGDSSTGSRGSRSLPWRERRRHALGVGDRRVKLGEGLLRNVQSARINAFEDSPTRLMPLVLTERRIDEHIRIDEVCVVSGRHRYRRAEAIRSPGRASTEVEEPETAAVLGAAVPACGGGVLMTAPATLGEDASSTAFGMVWNPPSGYQARAVAAVHPS